MYKKLREPINSITHFAGAGLSLLALIAMLIKTISSNASEKAVEWMKEHPEFGQARASLMLEWQKTHPDEILKIRRENIKKATEARKKRVQCVETGEIFESASEAARKIPGTTQSKICMVCRGQRKTCGGYHWQYVKEDL